MGTTSWGTAIVEAARNLRVRLHDEYGGVVPAEGLEAIGEVGDNPEDDPHVSPMGAKGLGEVGITGTAAAIANAVYHATGIRIRDLPITLDKLLS